MAKGAIAKEQVAAMIAAAFEDKYIGEFDKKLYVWAEENGEQVQVAISLTCPKNPIAVQAAPTTNLGVDDNGDWDFSDDAKPAAPAQPATATITDEERAKVAELMKKLGL